MTDTLKEQDKVLRKLRRTKTPLRVLLAPNPEWGGVMPFFPLAEALRAAGHTVFFSGPPPNEFFLRKCGIDVSRIIRAIENRGFEYLAVFRRITDYPAPPGSAADPELGSEKCWMGTFRLLNTLLLSLTDEIKEIVKSR